MKLIRTAEIKIADGKKLGKIGGPVHLGVGQEAVATGVSKHLKKTDRVFGAHRSHSHLLAMNQNCFGLFAETLGKPSGNSKGMGGSMHLWDQPNGFYGSVPIVSGTVSLAVGAALAAKLKKTSDIAVAYLGDGAVEEGVVHESLNLASILKLPVLFVVENNLFSSHMHISLRQPYDSTARFAEVNNIENKIVDGNDVTSVSQSAKCLIDNIRETSSPGFLEAVTYRWYGHVDWRTDIDVGIKRSESDIESWKSRDPIKRLEDSMSTNSLITDEEINHIEKSINDKINKEWDRAINSESHNQNNLLKNTYSNKK